MAKTALSEKQFKKRKFTSQISVCGGKGGEGPVDGPANISYIEFNAPYFLSSQKHDCKWLFRIFGFKKELEIIS